MKMKVKLSFSDKSKHNVVHVTKAYGGVEVYLLSFLTLALDALTTLPTGNELPVHM
jgi:hypothetical protein